MSSSLHRSGPEPAARCACLLGEGPVWSAAENMLYWVDLNAPALWRMAWPPGTPSRWTPPIRVTAIAPRAAGGLIAASDAGFAFIDFDRQSLDPIGHPEPDRPGNRFNDGKVDRSGAFWAGTMDNAELAASGALYRLAPSLEWARVDDDYRVTNGPAFSPDGAWMYHSDSARQIVYRFALQPGGAVGDRETFLRFALGDGYPDGMTVDAEGCLWISFWDGWCLRRFSPDGALLDRVDLPVRRPTSCTFGGAGLAYLFITSARIGLSDEEWAEQPNAGDLFVMKPSVGGAAQPPFAA